MHKETPFATAAQASTTKFWLAWPEKSDSAELLEAGDSESLAPLKSGMCNDDGYLSVKGTSCCAGTEQMATCALMLGPHPVLILTHLVAD